MGKVSLRNPSPCSQELLIAFGTEDSSPIHDSNFVSLILCMSCIHNSNERMCSSLKVITISHPLLLKDHGLSWRGQQRLFGVRGSGCLYQNSSLYELCFCLFVVCLLFCFKCIVPFVYERIAWIDLCESLWCLATIEARRGYQTTWNWNYILLLAGDWT